MNDILRDREHASVRLVMNPDRMVIGEAMRTFTYLNLYGYLTDAVVVNRVFPEEVGGTYFDTWRELQQEHLALVESAFSPVPVLRRPTSSEEVTAPVMLDRLGEELFAAHDAGAMLHDRLTQELTSSTTTARRCGWTCPFAQKGDVSLQKIGLELVVGVDGHKRTIMLPPALAPYSPRAAISRRGRWR